MCRWWRTSGPGRTGEMRRGRRRPARLGEDLPADAFGDDRCFSAVERHAVGLVPLATGVVIAMAGGPAAHAVAVQVRAFVSRDEAVVFVRDGEEVGRFAIVLQDVLA